MSWNDDNINDDWGNAATVVVLRMLLIVLRVIAACRGRGRRRRKWQRSTRESTQLKEEVYSYGIDVKAVLTIAINTMTTSKSRLTSLVDSAPQFGFASCWGDNWKGRAPEDSAYPGLYQLPAFLNTSCVRRSRHEMGILLLPSASSTTLRFYNTCTGTPVFELQQNAGNRT